MNRPLTPLDRAIVLATTAHSGQLDKQGEPYILHCLRVMLAGATEDERIVGVLHDVCEDTPTTFSDVASAFGYGIAEAVNVLTRRKHVDSYAQYVHWLGRNPLARRVKLNDLADNLGRINQLPVPVGRELWERYTRAKLYLEGIEAASPSTHEPRP